MLEDAPQFSGKTFLPCVVKTSCDSLRLKPMHMECRSSFGMGVLCPWRSILPSADTKATPDVHPLSGCFYVFQAMQL